MKNNYLHIGNTTKKSSTRVRPVFRAFGVAAAVTLAGVALRVTLAAGPEQSLWPVSLWRLAPSTRVPEAANRRLLRRILTLQTITVSR